MIERTEARFGLRPQRLAGDTAYGAAPMLNWIVEEKSIAPHIPVFDRSKREDGTFSREGFRYDDGSDTYICPAGKALATSGTVVNDGSSRDQTELRAVPIEGAMLSEHARPKDPSKYL